MSAQQVPGWGANGVTVNRSLPEQQVTITNWGATQVRLPFQALQPYGYLRKLYLWSPFTSFTAAISAGPVPNVLTQLGPWRAIQRFQLNTQGASAIYDVTGEDLAILNAYGNGRRVLESANNTAIISGIVGAPANSLPPYGSPFGTTNAQQFASTVQNSGTTALFGYYAPIPITEVLKIKNIATGAGPAIADMEVELGMLTLQNIQQNVTPNITLNPVWSQDYISPFKSSGAGSVTLPSVSWNLSRESYDVPPLQQQLPPGFLQDYTISRLASDVAISGGKVTYNFANAGMLMRVFYLFYNDGGTVGTNGQWVDIGDGNNNAATIQFGFGSIVNKIQETVQENLARSAYQLGFNFPVLVHDFMRDQSEVQMPNTINQTNIRTTFSGLNTATGVVPNRLHVIEERLIPVTRQ